MVRSKVSISATLGVGTVTAKVVLPSMSDYAQIHMGTLAMTQSEREQFLSELHVGVLGIERPDGPPLTVPVWYVYEPGGELWFLISPRLGERPASPEINAIQSLRSVRVASLQICVDRGNRNNLPFRQGTARPPHCASLPGRKGRG